jgi:integrase
MRPLTPIAIENLKPGSKRYEVPDGGARGLRVVVQPSGRKSFAVRYRNAAGHARKFTLPAGITLAAARKLAADALLEVAQGNDPATSKQEARRARGTRTDDTIERWAKAFIERHAKKKTRYHSRRQTEHVFDDIVLPTWRGRTIHDIKRKHVRELLEELAETKPIMANRVRGVLSKFFNWLCERDDDLVSPVIGVRPPAHENVRERALNDDELVRLWKAAEAIGGREGACIKLLVLSGQRRSEISDLKWSEIDGDTLALPAERMKGKRAHTVPLSLQARTIIDGMPQLVPQVPRPGDYVFGKVHFHRLKPKLDAHMGSAPPWVIHDIRRSVASGMARIGVAVPVIEKILAHKSGTFRGIVGVYQRHSFLPEMTTALQKWGDYIERLIGGEPAAVVKLPQRR